jgi:hypothetical protein
MTPYLKIYDMANMSYGLNGGCESSLIKPIIPDTFTATAVDNTNIELSWDETSADFDFLEIERSLTDGNYVKIVEINATTPAGVQTYTNSGLTKNTTYYYRMRSHKRFKFSDYSKANAKTTNV